MPVLRRVNPADVSAFALGRRRFTLDYREAMRRRAYVDSHVPFEAALQAALEWAGDTATLHVPDTRSVEENDLEDPGLPITCVSRKSRFYGRPEGTVIGAFLNVGEVLEVERHDVDGIVVMQARGPTRYAPSVPSHAPWITAFAVEPLTEREIAPTPEASAPLKAAVKGLYGMAIRNQGLIDKRERSEVVQTLTYLRDHGVRLQPDGLMVEALRNGWGGQGPEQLHAIAVDLAKGKSLRFDRRIRPERLEEWGNAQ
jgi:hypothetical protein